MNLQKIAFISCIKDEIYWNESCLYLKHLKVPEGFEFEIKPYHNIDQIQVAYNQAQMETDAKYKIYLSDHVLILDQDFITKLLDVFANNPQIGLVGAAGTHQLPLNCEFWNSNEIYGNLYSRKQNSIQPIRVVPNNEPFEKGVLLDGFLIATQYDLPWREDLGLSDQLAGLSQSLEFQKADYQTAALIPETPICLYDADPMNRTIDAQAKEKFLSAYASLLFPKVSVLIPTYNRPVYFEEALQSVLKQTYKNIELVICDDSTNQETELLMQSYLEKYPTIRYIKNETNLGQFENDLKLFELASGEYINFLMDDDLFHPQKIEKMMEHFLNDRNEELKLITSHRVSIDGNGNMITPVNSPVFKEDTVAEGVQFGNLVLIHNANFIGEPTTVLFRKKDLQVPFGTFTGRRYYCNVDMATWLNLLADGKALYLVEPLSYFRIHGLQQLQSVPMLIGGVVDYAHEILSAPAKGFLVDKQVFKRAQEKWFAYASYVIKHIQENNLTGNIDEILAYYKKMESIYSGNEEPVTLESVR